MADVKTILNACELVWRQQSLGKTSITDMRTELESHLLDAQRAGKSPDAVVGTDLDRFARSWAAAQPADRTMPAGLSPNQTELTAEAERTKMRLYISIGAILIVTFLGMLLGPKSDYADLETWQLIFVVSTFGLLIGEVTTGGFFVLPFAIAAASGSVLSFTKVEPPALLAVTILVSVLAFWGLREFASRDDDEIFPVGASRYVDQTAIVTEMISGVGSLGRVRFETESWMAITDSNAFIPEGTIVRIDEVRGARFVVTPT